MCSNLSNQRTNFLGPHLKDQKRRLKNGVLKSEFVRLYRMSLMVSVDWVTLGRCLGGWIRDRDPNRLCRVEVPLVIHFDTDPRVPDFLDSSIFQ